jgi:hypothetical protein
MKASRLLLVLVLIAGLAITMGPSYAAKAKANCVLAGSVQLSAPQNLTTTTYGSGSFTASSLLQCVGSAVAGQGSPASSSFSFCQHNFVGPNSACHSTSYNGPNLTLEPLYDITNSQKNPAKIVAHAKGTASFGGFTGGVSCSLSFEGHAFSTIAELTIQSFTCSNGFVGKGTAYAAAVPVINNVTNCPAGAGGVKLCFSNLFFSGVIKINGNK